MKDKIGILTFQNTLNYGAHLQAFALCETLKKLGIESEIIDYNCNKITSQYSLHFKDNNSSLKSIIKWFFSIWFLEKKTQGFSEYLKNNLSAKKYDKENVNQLEEDYGTIIVGSDQVWNLELTGGDTTYLLDFTKNIKKISYAASIGKTILEKQEKECLKECLSDFYAISVREREVENLLNDLDIKNRGQMIDPTFLLDKSEWEVQLKKIRKKYKKKDEYILVYAQGRPQYGIEFAKKLAKKEGCKIKVIHQYARKYKGIENIRDASVEEFLYLLANAKHVITTSFHGIALSLILHTSVFFEMKHALKNTNSRIISLAELFQIEDREIESTECSKEVGEIDFIKIDQIIQKERKKSLKFLNEVYRENEVIL